MTTTAVSEAQIFKDLDKDVKALNNCKDFRGTIEQVKDGLVARIRDTHGPKKGHGNPKRTASEISHWKSINTVICRREEVYRILKDSFGGDENRFYACFTMSVAEQNRLTEKAKKGKRKASDLEGEDSIADSDKYLLPFGSVCNQKKHVDNTLSEERDKVEYQVEGQFSQAVWDARFEGMNEWEMWRAILNMKDSA